MAEKVFTKNDAVALMHKDSASGLRKIADHIERLKYNKKEITKLLREIADEREAQSMIVELRDTL